MKRITTLIATIALAAVSAGAQPGPVPPEGRMDDDDIISMQTMDIVEWLDLDSKTESKFVKEYTAFRKEIDAVSKKAQPPRDVMDESGIDKAIRQNFEVSEKILEIRKDYYERFRKFLKPSQIQMVYRFENEAGKRMQGAPGRPGGPEGPEGPGGPMGPDGPRRPDGPGRPGGPEGPGRY